MNKMPATNKETLETSRAAKGLARGRCVLGLFLVAFSALVGRFYFLQIDQHDFYSSLAKRQYTYTMKLKPRRGSISDRRGRALAKSIEVPSAFAVPSAVENKRVFARKVSKILGVSENKIFKRLNKSRHFAYLKRHINVKEKNALEALNLKGLRFEQEAKRYYPNHELASHVIGFAGIDNNGLEGIERVYNDVLKGEPGFRIVSRDARSRKMTLDDGQFQAAYDGNGVSLTLDLAIQAIAREQLAKSVEKFTPLSATVIVMDVQTGDVLAMSNMPEFNPNDIRSASADSRRNVAVSDVFEPGSTFKAFVAGYVMDAGLAKRDDKVFCENGAYKIKRRTLHDHHPYGWLSLEDVIVKSSNIGAAKLGFLMGQPALQHMVRQLGFGQKTGIGLPGESRGLVRPDKSWSYFSMTSIPMGHEIGLTPIQLVTAFSSMVNGGFAVKPRIVAKITDGEGRVLRDFPNATPQRILSEQTSKELRKILAQVVIRGTAKRAKLKYYQVGGKTGTSQKLVDGKYSHEKYYSSFVGFAPFNKPRLCVLMGINEPHGSHYGGTVAAPYVAKILEESLSYLRVAPEPLQVASE